MTAFRDEMDARLRRMEGMLSMLIQHVGEDVEALREEVARLEESERVAYRRGYMTGHHTASAGRESDPDGAQANRRRRRAVAA